MLSQSSAGGPIRAGIACRLRVLVLLFALSLFASSRLPALDSASNPLRDEWIDRDTGHRVLRLSRIPGESESSYFHQNAFTATGDKMVFANTSTNRSHDFVVYDWRARKIDR